jgi:hypothetical protein
MISRLNILSAILLTISLGHSTGSLANLSFSLNAGTSCHDPSSCESTLVYSNTLNETWESDANLLGTMQSIDSNIINKIIQANGSALVDGHQLVPEDFGSNGLVNWWGALAFVSYTNSIEWVANSYDGLPDCYPYSQNGVFPVTESLPSASDLITLLNNEIPASSGFFLNVLDSTGYWTTSPQETDPSLASVIINGSASLVSKNNMYYEWSVSQSSVVSYVPIPSSVWLFSTALFGFFGFNSRKTIGQLT